MVQPIPKRMPAEEGEPQRWVLGELYEDAICIFVHRRVLKEILDYSEMDTQRELGGFLVGGFHSDRGLYIEVRHFVPAVDVRSRATSLTFTHETWAQMNREVERRYPEHRVVGWQHTHPRLGIFLSGYDLFIHRHFFQQPWQIAMVVDPIARRFGFFQWRGSDVVSCGFVGVGQTGSTKRGRRDAPAS